MRYIVPHEVGKSYYSLSIYERYIVLLEYEFQPESVLIHSYNRMKIITQELLVNQKKG